MPQKATSERVRDNLTKQQLIALERLLLGDKVTDAAKSAQVSRETLHRWLRENWTFQAALNQRQAEIQRAVRSKLLATAEKAVDTVANAIEKGDLKAALTLLKGVGILSGQEPRIGDADPDVLKAEAEIAEQQAQSDRLMRSLLVFFKSSETTPTASR